MMTRSRSSLNIELLIIHLIKLFIIHLISYPVSHLSLIVIYHCLLSWFCSMLIIFSSIQSCIIIASWYSISVKDELSVHAILRPCVKTVNVH